MIRVRVVLISVATITMVLLFAVPALAHGPRWTIGEGRVDIREGHQFLAKSQMLMAEGQFQGAAHQEQMGKFAIREGRRDVQQGQAMLRHQR